MKRTFASMLAAGLAAALSAPPDTAQTPPSGADIAGYRDLHAAAQTGDVPTIERLAAAGAAVDARDRQGRTSLHIAAYARQWEAIQVLVKLGADPRALDAQRYDTVTIAAVADDVATMRVALAIGSLTRPARRPHRRAGL